MQSILKPITNLFTMIFQAIHGFVASLDIFGVGAGYVITIFLLTLLVRLILLPLNIKQTRSQQKMQEIQPEIAKLQKKYKNNPEKAQQEKLAKDQALNLEKQKQLEEKALKASIIQMIKQHKITDFAGDVAYQFIDENKIKKVYLSQQVYNALVAGSLVIAKDQDQYAYLPKALGEKIDQKMQGFILINNAEKNEQATDEEDPYAAYVIPDDLMW
ncbi:MAG: DUF2058 family protein [Acinetobacter sp.]|nr:DUF2058 family protein [Acinetobacter sp.]